MTEVIIPHNIDINEGSLADATLVTLENTAGSVNFLNTVNNQGISVNQQLANKHIENEINQARKRGEFTWYEVMTSSPHILELYAARESMDTVDGLRWNNRDPDRTPREDLKEIFRVRRERDLELIGYLKLAQELGIKMKLYEDLKNLRYYRGDNTAIDHTILDNLGEEIDAIVLGLREDLMIPSQEKIK